MDPLSVASSIAGLVSAAAMVNTALAPYMQAVRDTPKIAFQVYSETQSTTIILGALQSLTTNLASIPRQRAALIQLDQVVAVLTDGVLIFSDLEACVGDLPAAEPGSITRLALRSRLGWARKESALTALLTRLEAFKSSMSLILSILQSDTNLQAEQSQQQLTNNVNLLLENSQNLARRLMNLEDVFDVRSTITRSTRRESIAESVTSASIASPGSVLGREDWPLPNPISSGESTSIIFSPTSSSFSQNWTGPSSVSVRTATPTGGPDDSIEAALAKSVSLQPPQQRPFEWDLELSRVYRRAQNTRNSMDFSFRSSIARTNAWSIFSGLSLGDISVLSVIALPIYADDLQNPHHYDFGGAMGQRNSILMETSIAVESAGPISLLAPTHSLWRSCIELEMLLVQLPDLKNQFFGSQYMHMYLTPPRHPFLNFQHTFVDRNGLSFLILLGALGAKTAFSSIHEFSLALLLDWPHETSRRAIREEIDKASNFHGIEHLFTVPDILGEQGKYGILKVLRACQTLSRLQLASGTFASVEDELNQWWEQHVSSNRTTWMIEDFIQSEIAYINKLALLVELEDCIIGSKYLSTKESRAVFSPIQKILELQINLLLNIEHNLFEAPTEQEWSEAFTKWSEGEKLYDEVISNERRNKALLRSRFAPSISIQAEIHTCLELLSIPPKRPGEYIRFATDLQRYSSDQVSKESSNDNNLGISKMSKESSFDNTLDISKALTVIKLTIVSIEGRAERRKESAKRARQLRPSWANKSPGHSPEPPAEDSRGRAEGLRASAAAKDVRTV
ncbi:hypothetical protein QBC43DRAFT_303568 [Cladorrhinum sp. PSN259]|nr:hypothetical protein QBC43DRAFT_303568 [Cladorrhinum sp. PSN259]